MEISGIIFIEEGNTNSIHLYKEGSFWKAYEHSAYLFVKHIKSYQTRLRYYKNIGQEVISIGFPDIALPTILEESNMIQQSETQVTLRLKEELVIEDFLVWKTQTPLTVIQKASKQEQNKTEQDSYLSISILSFPVANKTPIECMQFIAELQKQLKIES
jgi:hypothetical protein